MTEIGVVHGRFQPFHNGHLEYVMAAISRCDHLLIGITQFDRSINDEKSPSHRLDIDENPFQYWERTLLIKSALMNLEIPSDKYSFVPFPIHQAERLVEFVPSTAKMFTTIYDDWNREKVKRLESVGFEVEVLWERDQKEFEGSTVRKLIRSGDKHLQKVIPEGTYKKLMKLLEMNSINSL